MLWDYLAKVKLINQKADFIDRITRLEKDFKNFQVTWEEIKKLSFNVLMADFCKQPINLLPKNPASKFIDIRSNFINFSF